MPRKRILSIVEQKALDTTPTFSALERKKYFFVSYQLRQLIDSLRTPTNQVFFLIQMGYFRATNRFFPNQYNPQDIQYVSLQLEIDVKLVDLTTYTESTGRRHRELILDYLGYLSFDDLGKKQLGTHLRPMVRSQLRLKLLYWEAMRFLSAHRTEIPGSGVLSQFILSLVKKHRQRLIDHIEQTLNESSRSLLDQLLDKPSDSSIQRTRLTLLKRFSHSTKTSKVRMNLDDLKTIKALYHPLRTSIQSLDLTPDGLRYYAHSVIRSEIFQISRRKEPGRYLHLLCFIAHQYFYLHDLLLDTLLKVVQSTHNTCQREHRNLYYEQRKKHQRAARLAFEGGCLTNVS